MLFETMNGEGSLLVQHTPGWLAVEGERTPQVATFSGTDTQKKTWVGAFTSTSRLGGVFAYLLERTALRALWLDLFLG